MEVRLIKVIFRKASVFSELCDSGTADTDKYTKYTAA